MSDDKMRTTIDPMPRQDHKVPQQEFRQMYGSGSIGCRDNEKPPVDREASPKPTIQHLNLGGS